MHVDSNNRRSNCSLSNSCIPNRRHNRGIASHPWLRGAPEPLLLEEMALLLAGLVQNGAGDQDGTHAVTNISGSGKPFL